MSIRGNTPIVGIGEIPTIGVFPERTFIESAVSVAEIAIKDAGIPKEDIDTIIPIGVAANRLDNNNVICSWLVEELGMWSHAKSAFRSCQADRAQPAP